MSILDSKVIDSIAERDDMRSIELAISDHLSWDDVNYHLEMPQEKIKAYISFYESKQYLSVYNDLPKNLDSCTICLYTKFKIPDNLKYIFESIEEQ